MSISTFLADLPAELSLSTEILFGSSTEKFKTALLRWTDLSLQVPGAIILVGSEDDLLKSVKLALKHNVPFVPKSGGHSLW